MHCILCLKIPEESINIFGEFALRLEIKEVISKHFWFQPNESDTYSNSICLHCWTILESFHKFYEEIKDAHSTIINIKPSKEDENFEVEENSSNKLLDDLNGVLCQSIKVELSDETNNERLQDCVDIKQNTKSPLNVDIKYDEDDENEHEVDESCEDSDSDSDSDDPLSKLVSCKVEKNEASESAASEKNQKSSAQDDPNINDEKLHIKNGIWLAKCVGEESSGKPITHLEFDKFIKLNMELMCEICRKPMKDFLNLQKHFKDNHANHKGKTFVTCCDRKFHLRSRLVDHILLHKHPNYFTCVVCSKVVSSRENLRKHMTIHDKKFIHQCDKCDKTFYRKQLLERHMDTHVEEKKFKCDDCDKFFTSKFSLGQHVYGVHKGGYKKICEQCGKVSRDQMAFVRHQMVHANLPTPFVECPKCGVKLIDKNGLRKHLQSQHPDETKEHICNECGIVTNSIFALRRHVSFMHKRQRDFKCPMCEKAFKRALTLKEHMTTHTGEVLYTCPHCPKTFNSNANMHSHRKKMHRKEWEENRRHPHLGTSANAAANRQAMANQNASEDNNTQ